MKINLRGVTLEVRRCRNLQKFLGSSRWRWSSAEAVLWRSMAAMAAVAMAAVIMAAVAMEAGIMAGVGAVFGGRIGGLTTITTNRVTAAGCAYRFCAMVIGWCSASGAAGNDQNTCSDFAEAASVGGLFISGSIIL